MGFANPGPEGLRAMLLGRPARLSSAFRLTYNMMLNVLRTDAPVTTIIQNLPKRSSILTGGRV